MSHPPVQQIESPAETFSKTLGGISDAMQTAANIRQQQHDQATNALLAQSKIDTEQATAAKTRLETQLTQAQIAHTQELVRQSQQQQAEARALATQHAAQTAESQQRTLDMQEAAQRHRDALATLRQGLSPDEFRSVSLAVAARDAGLPESTVNTIIGAASPATLPGLRRKYPQFADVPDVELASTVAKHILQRQTELYTGTGRVPTASQYIDKHLHGLTGGSETVGHIPMSRTAAIAQLRDEYKAVYGGGQTDGKHAAVTIQNYSRPLPDTQLEGIAKSIAPGLSRVNGGTPGGLLRALDAAGQAVGRTLTTPERQRVLFRARAINVKPAPAATQ